MIILVAAGLAEAYTAATVPVSIPRDGNVTMVSRPVSSLAEV